MRTRAAAAALCALALSCGAGGTAPPGPDPFAFTLGSISFELISGAAAITSGVLTLYLTDQANGCEALQRVKTGNPPVGSFTSLALHVAAGSDGSMLATVVAPTPLPGPGKAAGALTLLQAGRQTASLDATDGSVAWSVDPVGNVIVSNIDLGFAGATHRLTARALYLPACSL